MRAAAGWGVAQTLRDKVALLRCGRWTFGVEARFVRQVGFEDLVTDLERGDGAMPGHVGCGLIGEAPCSLWDLGRHLGVATESRAIIALDRPGGVLAMRCSEILSVEAVATRERLELPRLLAPHRPDLYKAVLVLPGEDEESDRIAYLLRASALLSRHEIVRAQRDWKRAISRV